MKRFNIIITLSATLGLFSCELDKMPMDQVSDAVFWQKPADFELAANDFYFGAPRGLPIYRHELGYRLWFRHERCQRRFLSGPGQLG